MMEFMLARVSSCVCAAIIIGLMFVPVTDNLMDRADEDTYDNCEAIGKALDGFIYSEATEAILFMNTYLPGEDCSISFDGSHLTLTDKDEEHIYQMRTDTTPDKESYTYRDAIRLTKRDGTLNIELVEFE